ncbi:hypothetical protein BDB01DRAFT_870740 [Pilobolus umbonatus]|nr:hypothetical protein BDB01DRAFT_870740 [Pilobolus umbonatus]
MSKVVFYFFQIIVSLKKKKYVKVFSTNSLKKTQSLPSPPSTNTHLILAFQICLYICLCKYV